MLTTILNNNPPPKCVIIQDSLALSGKNVLLSIIRAHLNLKKHCVHLFLFENSPEKIKRLLSNQNLFVYDCISDANGWLDSSNKDKFIEIINKNDLKGIIVIDSLAHVIIEYGIAQSYRILHNLLDKKDNKLVQVLSLLHEDTLEQKLQVLKYFDHIATLFMTLSPIEGRTSRVRYWFKKSAGKIIKETEEYCFANDLLQTKSLDKIDARVLLPNTTPDQLPENLSTFRISLDENEKISRDQLTLPYLKQANLTEAGSGGGNVIYNLDDIDDWDEEDPDDDLDI